MPWSQDLTLWEPPTCRTGVLSRLDKHDCRPVSFRLAWKRTIARCEMSQSLWLAARPHPATLFYCAIGDWVTAVNRTVKKRYALKIFRRLLISLQLLQWAVCDVTTARGRCTVLFVGDLPKICFSWIQVAQNLITVTLWKTLWELCL